VIRDLHLSYILILAMSESHACLSCIVPSAASESTVSSRCIPRKVISIYPLRMLRFSKNCFLKYFLKIEQTRVDRSTSQIAVPLGVVVRWRTWPDGELSFRGFHFEERGTAWRHKLLTIHNNIHIKPGICRRSTRHSDTCGRASKFHHGSKLKSLGKSVGQFPQN